MWNMNLLWNPFGCKIQTNPRQLSLRWKALRMLFDDFKSLKSRWKYLKDICIMKVSAVKSAERICGRQVFWAIPITFFFCCVFCCCIFCALFLWNSEIWNRDSGSWMPRFFSVIFSGVLLSQLRTFQACSMCLLSFFWVLRQFWCWNRWGKL